MLPEVILELWLLWWLEMGVSFLLSLKFRHFPKHARFLLWKNTRDKNIYFCSGSSCGRLLYCFWACGKVEHCEKGGKGTGVCKGWGASASICMNSSPPPVYLSIWKHLLLGRAGKGAGAVQESVKCQGRPCQSGSAAPQPSKKSLEEMGTQHPILPSRSNQQARQRQKTKESVPPTGQW